MSKKISIQEKKKWLDMYEQGKTEVQIARQIGRDPRTIAKGLEEASKERRLASAEAEMLRNALFKHQDQLTGILKNIAAMLVMPPYNLEMREEREGILAPIPLSGDHLKHVSKEQMVLEIHDEDKLEWELLKEHLKQDKLWEYIKQWRKAMLDHIWARWQFKLADKTKLVKATGLKFKKGQDDDSYEYLLPEAVGLLFEVAMKKTLGVSDETDLKNGIVADDDFVRHRQGGTKLARCKNTEECRKKIIYVYDSLLVSSEAYKVKSTYEVLSSITRVAKRQIDEIMLLGMITGKCRVCRRLGR